ncbi:hypothetical protein MHUMG1_09384 [Metarhizium humberi]|uniref:Flavin monooxygenase-like protein n=1 Tax=Metarhizium humberi TaxID=2596975 RepID=A0A9P8M279_9HYPO|nr:hypothetical protein MHUMG1_09384 [Metarhizium humberi]
MTESQDTSGNDGGASFLADRSIDDYRPIRVVVIGAGISGILASTRFPQRIPNLSLAVYEKNEDIGGTWFENRYPGCACDIPAHVYQATFSPNTEWSQFYASSQEIHAYWKKVARKYDCMKYIKLRQQVAGAVWDNQESKWTLKIRDLVQNSEYTDKCDVLISATGALNSWNWPDIPGLQKFRGKLLHSAAWDESYDYEGQRVAVIGNGSSGIQILPAMLPKVSHIDHYIRGKTWLSPTFARAMIDERRGGIDNFTFTEEEKAAFKEDKSVYQEFRKNIELELQSVHGSTIRDTPEQLGAVGLFTEAMKKRLEKKPDLAETLIPSFPPICRRLTPGPGYLEALTDDKVSVITQGIVQIDETGIQTQDGKHHPVDAIVCATGFDTSFMPRIPIIGSQGQSLAERWKAVPETYLSMSTDGFPNFFVSLGPNGSLGSGNLLLLIEKAMDYMTMCVAKMQRDNIVAMAPQKQAVQRFTKYCDAYFDKTVFTLHCRSWYKGGTYDGRVSALWPGSSLHAMQVFAHPRWEDFEYRYGKGDVNSWIGDGWTQQEKARAVNVDYLDDGQIDFPPVPLPSPAPTPTSDAPRL